MKENEQGETRDVGSGASGDKIVTSLTGKMRLPQMIDVVQRCGEATATAITEEDMVTKLNLSREQWTADITGDEERQDHLTWRLNVAYKDLFARVRQNSYRNSLQTIVSAVKRMGKELGIAVTEEEMAARINLSVDQLNAYVNGNTPVPANLSHVLHVAYEDLFKAHAQHNRTARLRNTISLIQERSGKKGLVITEDEMADRVGLSRSGFDAFLKEEDKAPDELAERLRASYSELLKGIGWVTMSSTKLVRPSLLFDLPDE